MRAALWSLQSPDSLAIPHGEFEPDVAIGAGSESRCASRSLMGSSNSSTRTDSGLRRGALAIPHGEFEHPRHATRDRLRQLSRDPSWGVRTRSVRTAHAAAQRWPRDPSWGVRTRATGTSWMAELRDLAIPHGEFEHLRDRCHGRCRRASRDPSWGVRTRGRSVSGVALEACSRSLMGSSNKASAKRTAGLVSDLAIPHGEFEPSRLADVAVGDRACSRSLMGSSNRDRAHAV